MALSLTTPVRAADSFTVEEGSAVVEGQTDTSIQVGVQSEKAVLRYDQFNIPAGYTVEFHHYIETPNAGVLARVTGGVFSDIAGTLLSNGLFFLINPAGIVIRETARISAAGFVASTLNLANDDFLQGRYRFTQDPGRAPGAVINQGQIVAKPGGLVALLGSAVTNTGLLEAQVGTVTLAAGRQATLSFDRDGWLAVAVDEPIESIAVNPDGTPAEAAIDQRGAITAPGGRVLIQAKALEGLFDRVVSMPSGIVEATSVVERNGRIELIGDGGTVALGGAIRADGSAGHPDGGEITVEATGLLHAGAISANGGDGGQGGTIHLLGNTVALLDGSVIEACGEDGGGTILIGGDYHGGGDVPGAWRTVVERGAVVHADALGAGHGGRVIVWADDTTWFSGTLTARGGATGGDGGFAEVSAGESLVFRGDVDLSALDGRIGTLLLDPATITIAGGTADGSDPGTKDSQLKSPSGSTDGRVLFADAPTPFTVYESELENTGANLILQATDGITTTGSFGGAQVLIKSGRDLTLETRNSSSAGDGAAGIDLTSSANGTNLEFRTEGTGSITIRTGTGSSPLAAPITVGKLTSGGMGAITVTGSGAVTIQQAATTADATGSETTSAPIALTSTKGEVVINGLVKTGAVSLADTSKSQTAASGGITVSAATSVTGSGRLVTGDAAITGASAAGTDQATSGSLVVSAGTGGVSGGIGLSHPQALTTGAAARTGAGAGTDRATAGSITLASLSEINNATASTALGVLLGAAAGGALNTPGVVTATTTGALGHLFLTSVNVLRLGAIKTHAGAAQTVSASTTGGAELLITDASETLAGDAVSFDAGIGTLTVLDHSLTVGSGSLTLTGNEVNLLGGANSIVGTGAVLLQSSSASQPLILGAGADSGPAALDVLTTDLAAFKNGFSSLTIGRADAMGGMTVNAITVSDPLTLQSPLGGIIAVNGQITGLDNASVTIKGAGSTTHLAANVVTAGQAITIQDAVRLLANVLLDTTQGGVVPLGGAMHITGPVNADAAANARTLTLRAGSLGAIALDGAIGVVEALQALTVTAAGSAILPSITTRQGGVSIASGATTLTGDLRTDAAADAGPLTLGGPTTLASDVLLDTDAATSDGAVTITGLLGGAHNLTINAGDAATVFNAAVGSLQALGSGTGAALTLNSAGLTTFNGTLVTASGVRAAGPVAFHGNVTLGDGDTDTQLDADVTLDAVHIAAADGLRLGEATADQITLIGGPVSITTADSPLVVAGSLNGAQALQLHAGTSSISLGTIGDITPLAALTIDQAGDVHLAGPATLAGALTQTDGSGTTSIEAAVQTGGAVSLANDAIAFLGSGSLQANGGTGAVRLVAQTGAITSGDAASDVIAGALSATAATSIGSLAQPLQTSVTSLGGGVTGAGDVVISETDAITLTGLTTAEGSVIVTAGGPITVDNGSLIVNGAGQDVSLTAASGDILVGHISAPDTIALTATAGGIEEFAPDAAADLSAPTVTLMAATGIGALQAIETDLETLNLSTGVGGATLHDLGSFTLNPVTIANDGSLTLTADGALQVAPLAEIRVTGLGALTLTAGAGGSGSLLVLEDPIAPKNTLGASLKSDAGAITLHDAGGMDVWRVTSSTGNLAISSAGMITLRDNIATGGAGTIDINAAGDLVTKWFLTSDTGAITLHSGQRMDLERSASNSGAIMATSDHDLILRGNLTTDGAGAILATAGDSITIQANGLVRAAGSGPLTLTAGTDGTGQLLVGTDGSIISGSGPIHLTSAQNMTLDRVTSTSGDLQITVSADLLAHDDLTTGGAGSIAVTANDSITIDPLASIRATGAGSINLTAGADGTGQFVMGSGSFISTASGLLSAASGSDTVFGRISTTGGDIQLTSNKALTLSDNVVTDGAGSIVIASKDMLTMSTGSLVRAIGSGGVTLGAGTDGTGQFLMNGTATVQTNSGPVALTSGEDMTLRRVTSASGNIQATAGKALTLADAIATDLTGMLTLSAKDAVTIDSAALIRTLGSGALSITSGTDGTGLLQMASGAQVSTNSGLLSLASNGGPMTVWRAASTSGNVQLASNTDIALQNVLSTGNGGSIVVGGGQSVTAADGSSVSIAGSGSLTAKAGTSGVGALTMLGNAFFETASGPLTLTSAGDMTLGRLSSATGSIVATSGKAMLAQQAIATGGAGNVDLTANDTLTVALPTATLIRTTGTGNLTVKAGADGVGGALVMNPGSAIQTASGALTLSDAGGMDLQTVTSTSGAIGISSLGAITLRNNIVTGSGGTVSVSAKDALSLALAAGTLVRTTGSGAVLLSAGTDGTGPFVSDGTSEVNSATGPVTLTSADDMTLGRVSSTSGAIQATAGKAMTILNAITTGGAGSVILSANDAMSLASGSVVRSLGTGGATLTAGADKAGGGLLMASNARVETGSGALTATSDGDMAIGRLTSASGAVQMTAGRSLTLQNAIVTGGGGTVSGTANDSIAVSLPAATLVRTTGSGALSLAAGVDGTGQFVMNSLSEINSASGPIILTAAGDMTLWRVTSGSGSITATAGKTLTINHSMVTGSAGSLSGNAGTILTLGPSALIRTTGTGGVALASGTGGLGGDFLMDGTASIESNSGLIQAVGAGDTTIGRISSTSGNIQVTSGKTLLIKNTLVTGGAGSINATANKSLTLDPNMPIKVNGTGTLTFIAGADASPGGDIKMNNSSSLATNSGAITLQSAGRTELRKVSSTSGNITMTAGKDLILPNNVTTGGSGVVTATAGNNLRVRFIQTATPVVLSAIAGAIERLASPTGPGTNLSAPSASMTAATGIGTGVDGIFETALETLRAAVTGTGDILLSELDAITLQSVTTADGSIAITAGGPITVANGTVAAGGAAHDVTLSTASGDLLVGTVTAGNQVTLTASGSILENGTDSDVDITASTAVLSAGGAIGESANPIETQIGSLRATAGAGGIFLSERDSLSLDSVSAGTDVVIQNTTGDLLVATVTAGAGVHLTAVSGSILDANADQTNVTAAADSSLSAGAVIGSELDPVDVQITNATLQVGAGGQVNGISAVLAGLVSPSNTLTIASPPPPGDVFFNGQIVFCADGSCP